MKTQSSLILCFVTRFCLSDDDDDESILKRKIFYAYIYAAFKKRDVRDININNVNINDDENINDTRERCKRYVVLFSFRRF